MTTSDPKKFIKACSERAHAAGYKVKIMLRPTPAFQWIGPEGACKKQTVPKQKNPAATVAAITVLASAWINQELNLGIVLFDPRTKQPPSDDGVVPFEPQPQPGES